MSIETIDPETLTFGGQTVSIVNDPKHLDTYHKIADFECAIEGIKRSKHILYGEKNVGLTGSSSVATTTSPSLQSKLS